MSRTAASLAVVVAMILCGSATAQPYVTDQFGRTLDSFGITLVDWEGQIANPALRFDLSPPVGATLPVTATLTATDARLYFDEPSTVGASGPSKSITFFSASPQPFRVSIFPDRDTNDETHTLAIAFVPAAGPTVNVSLPLRVVDQDVSGPAPFNVTVDFSRDLSGFFSNATRRQIVTEAARDWTYFIDDLQLDPVGVGDETTFIWNWPLAWTGPMPQGYFHTNTLGFTGFLLYAYGVETPELRSGGAPSLCCLQSTGGSPLDLRRSGTVEIEHRGNFNTLGWFLTAADDDWHTSGNRDWEPNDLYSIAQHEFGHALAFNSGYPAFADGETNGFFDPEVIAYYGAEIYSDSFDHFDGYIDPASGYGAFGYEYFGDVPRRRWLITKLDLLLMQAVGYSLRPTSAFAPLAIRPGSLPNGHVGSAYSAGLAADGGIPFYDWQIDSGALPPGLTLDRFTGQIAGTPTSGGTFDFVVRVRDYSDYPGVTAPRSITITSCLLGDVNSDTRINGLDVQGFVRVKLIGTGTPSELCAASITVPQYVALLLGT